VTRGKKTFDDSTYLFTLYDIRAAHVMQSTMKIVDILVHQYL